MPKKLLCVMVLVTVIVSALLVGYYLLYRGSDQTAQSWKAAIVDQLSIDETFRNATFVDKATVLLNSAGYDVKYYNGNEVDVDFYTTLPLNGYKVVILRVHSAVRLDSNHYVDLFTSELYVEGKYWELGDQVSKAVFFSRPGAEYFAIGPTFVRQSMNGNFNDALIIMMGCSSLNYTTMAEELRGKGARVVIGWTDLILPSETDHYTILLLQYLLNPNNPSTVKSAIDSINLELSRRPTLYGSKLSFHTTQEGSYIVPVRKEGGTANKLGAEIVFQIRIPMSAVDFRSYLKRP